jgi:hypothetical protein
MNDPLVKAGVSAVIRSTGVQLRRASQVGQRAFYRANQAE